MDYMCHYDVSFGSTIPAESTESTSDHREKHSRTSLRLPMCQYIHIYTNPLTAHVLTAASAPTLTILSSPSHTTPPTPSLCAPAALTLFPGLAKLHTNTFVSRLPLAANWPSGRQAMLVIRDVWALQRLVRSELSDVLKTEMPPLARPMASFEASWEKARVDAGAVRLLICAEAS